MRAPGKGVGVGSGVGVMVGVGVRLGAAVADGAAVAKSKGEAILREQERELNTTYKSGNTSQRLIWRGLILQWIIDENITQAGAGVNEPAVQEYARAAHTLTKTYCRAKLFLFKEIPCLEMVMRTLEWNPDLQTLQMIDQRLLPGELRFVQLSDATQVAQAIRDMVVRGAPAIGVAAAFGLVVGGTKI